VTYPAKVQEARARGTSLVDGIPIDDVSIDEALDVITSFVESGRATGRTYQVVTVNVDFVVNAKHDERLRRVLQGADLSLPDGTPILWYSRLAGTPLRERVAGADLVPLIAERSITSGHRILLFGSAGGVAEQARDLLRKRHPGASVEGLSGPYILDVTQMAESDLDEIRALRPDIICVALGNPKQEHWIAANRHLIGVPVLIGVGGTLDFLVGGRKRAPSWMQRTGLEWVFRASQEPKRLGKRYGRDLRVFAPIMLRVSGRWLRTRGTSPSTVGIRRDVADKTSTINVSGASTSASIGSNACRSAKRPTGNSHRRRPVP
jgi:N-acetylglucosaminyldiphosphoundecaprenol N-acetyl-beta-D-mannosaminyltransferase